MKHQFTPKLFTTLGIYNRHIFTKDLIAGVIVGIIAIPLAIALAISSGVTPEMGIYTAIIAGFVISFLGGSQVQIGGPTAAFIPIVYAIIREHQIEGLIIATFLAGIFLIFMGIFKLGKIIKFIPYTVIAGFTSGLAVSIIIKQLKDLLGLSIATLPIDFYDLLVTYFYNLTSIHFPTVLISTLAIFITLFWHKLHWKIIRYIPGSLVAIVVTTFLVYSLNMPNIATIGSTFNNIHIGIPSINFPTHITLNLLKTLISPALTIAILAGIESLLSAVIADGMIGGYHRSNMELIAQGVANMCSALVGGLPATGAIARTATNIKNGGRTPIAGIIHAITIFVITLLFMPLAKQIPLAALSAILIVVAVKMGDWQIFKNIRKFPKSDVLVLLITFTLTIVFDIVIAIETGMVLAALLFIKQMSKITKINYLSEIDEDEKDNLNNTETREYLDKKFKKQVLLYEIHGPFFFGAADKLMTVISNIGIETKLILLNMKEVPFIDSTGLHFLKILLQACKQKKVALYFINVPKAPFSTLLKTDFINLLGHDHICPNISSALKHHYKQ